MMMRTKTGRIALDVALLLPEKVNDVVRKLNQQIDQVEGEAFAFDDSHLPHLTLVQQSTGEDRFPELERIIGTVASKYGALELTARVTARRGSSAHLVIEPNEELRRLHEHLTDSLEPLADASAEAASFHDPGGEPPRSRDREWVTGFRANASHDRFGPHVTLGVGDAPPLDQVLTFTVSNLALCWLGRHCTCQVVLREWPLGRAVP